MTIMRWILLVLFVLPLGLAPAAVEAVTVQAPTLAATDGPGALSHFDLARKDCFGTARNRTSKVWFTLANGVLSDVYYPTLDNTNVETLQYIVTDGATFTDLQTRNTTYSVRSTDRRSLSCEITTTATSGKYRIVSQYVTDPDRNTLLIQSRFTALVGRRTDYHVYVRFDPSLNGNGGGGGANGGGDSASVDQSLGQAVPTACDTTTRSNAVNRDYAQPVCSALLADEPFVSVSNGFVGAPSDGLVQLDGARTLTSFTTEATNGNVVQTAEVDLSNHNDFVLALGFGSATSEAVRATTTSLRRGFDHAAEAYDASWHRYDDQLTAPPHDFEGVPERTWKTLVDQYFRSVNVVKGSEDKTFPGALVASIASPWGQAVSAGDPNNLFFGSYREVFARDVYEAWTGLLLAGDVQTAADVVRFMFQRQQSEDGSFPRNSLLNGRTAPDSFNTQLDEVSYPILMAWQIGMRDRALYSAHIKPAANFLISHGPSFGPERWEEQGGYSPSTIAAEITGLIAAADIAQSNGDPDSAHVWRGVADQFQRSVKGWTVTTSGPLGSRYFIRLSKTGDPNAAISYGLGNGHGTLDQRRVIDAGFLELARLGLLPADDPDIVATLPIVDNTIKSTTPSGDGWHRYNDDGYGDGASDGHPWAPSGKGDGHVWPLLAEERGEYALSVGQRAKAVDVLMTMQRSASGVGLIPEQVWERPDLPAAPLGTDPTIASIGFQNGRPAGSAAPLTWAAGSFARLMRDTLQDRLIEQPDVTLDRYVRHAQGQTNLTLTAPPDESSVSGSGPTTTVTISGTSVPGNTIAIAATNTDHNSDTTVQQTQADSAGNFSVTITVAGGTTVFNVVAVAPNGDTGQASRTVVYDFTPGTVVLDINGSSTPSEPTGDDNGAGTYAYPTSSDFHAGAFDIQQFKVIDGGASITFKLQVRDLTPTFGSPLGAQLVDVYVRTPGATPTNTSTAAAFPQRNYSIAAAGAWDQLLEVQGFGQRYVDAHNHALGTIQISANRISRFITFSVPAATLGHPTSGWRFTVVLTGQDGFSPDQARGFAPTPQPFLFGLCAPGGVSPICAADPNTAPKVMDVLTPVGVSQSDELNFVTHAVVLQPISIP
jgi:glucoamylase